MTDLEWARAFVGCKIEGTGRRFNETVDVLVKKLAEARRDGCSAENPLQAVRSQRSAISSDGPSPVRLAGTNVSATADLGPLGGNLES
jgi:hypothetical protein